MVVDLPESTYVGVSLEISACITMAAANDECFVWNVHGR